jgi:hypothetical protein
MKAENCSCLPADPGPDGDRLARRGGGQGTQAANRRRMPCNQAAAADTHRQQNAKVGRTIAASLLVT